jgi:UPF0271 protein
MSLKLASGASCLVNINCDLGEGLANDAELMPYLHSCNIACGGHAGDAQSVAAAVSLAIANNVLIGAHPSFPDQQNFGRAAISISADDLFASLVEQIELVRDECLRQGVRLNHVKAHGALYNLMCEDAALQKIVEDAICHVDADLPIYAPPLFDSARLNIIREGFADRGYQKDWRLLPRDQEGALITDAAHALSQSRLLSKFDTLCVHGDNPSALEIVKLLSQRLVEYLPYGDEHYLIRWPQKIHPDILWAVLAARDALQIAFPTAKLVHAYCSLLIHQRDLDKIKQVVEASSIVEVSGKIHHIEVNYSVDEFAAVVGLSANKVIQLHTEPEYLIYFLGFLPGFPYLGGLDPHLHLPRLAQPKQNIAAGSVAIGGQQTGIYPQQSPGGWHVIGHTDFELWPTQLAAGDRIKFIAR